MKAAVGQKIITNSNRSRFSPSPTRGPLPTKRDIAANTGRCPYFNHPVHGEFLNSRGSINTAGAVSRSKAGTLFVAERGLAGGIEVLEPAQKMLASSFNGKPFECIGGVLNDLSADAKGGVYFSVTGATQSGVFYASPTGVVSRYGKDVPLANGIVLSPERRRCTSPTARSFTHLT